MTFLRRHEWHEYDALFLWICRCGGRHVVLLLGGVCSIGMVLLGPLDGKEKLWGEGEVKSTEAGGCTSVMAKTKGSRGRWLWMEGGRAAAAGGGAEGKVQSGRGGHL